MIQVGIPQSARDAAFAAGEEYGNVIPSAAIVESYITENWLGVKVPGWQILAEYCRKQAEQVPEGQRSIASIHLCWLAQDAARARIKARALAVIDAAKPNRGGGRRP